MNKKEHFEELKKKRDLLNKEFKDKFQKFATENKCSVHVNAFFCPDEVKSITPKIALVFDYADNPEFLTQV